MHGACTPHSRYVEFIFLQRTLEWHIEARPYHYTDVLMGAIASQITSLTIVYSTVYSDADQRKHQSSAPLAFVRWTGEFPARMASNAVKVSIWWRHHDGQWVVCLSFQVNRNATFVIVVLRAMSYYIASWYVESLWLTVSLSIDTKESDFTGKSTALWIGCSGKVERKYCHSNLLW